LTTPCNVGKTNINVLVYLRYLKKMDKDNFEDNIIEVVELAIVDFVNDLHRGLIHKENVFDDDEEDDGSDTHPVKRRRNTLSSSAYYKDDTVDHEDADDEDDVMKCLYEEVREDIDEEKKSRTNREVVIESKRSKLLDVIKLQVSNYRRYCETIDITKLLEEYGNEEYRSDLKNKVVNVKKLVHYHDALYANRYLDLLMWWNCFGKINYPMLASAACIVLGKPTHNAFQERVFSRGTYADSNLKKNMKEDNFEMAVLNSLNCKKMDEIYKRHDLGMIKRNYNAHLTTFFDTEKYQLKDKIFNSTDVLELVHGRSHPLDEEFDISTEDDGKITVIESEGSDYDEFDLAFQEDNVTSTSEANVTEIEEEPYM
jgi:hypothetical protein